MSVRLMTQDDLRMVLGWAGEEGWNPGQDDAAAFFAADPEGFFLKEVDGHPAAAISVVNHDAHSAFLGLYICRPEYRGQGHGLEIWRAALAHAGSRCVGLDGVPDQQANYARSGFARYGRTIRYQGAIPPGTGPGVRVAGPAEIDSLIAADARATGVHRRAFSTGWFTGTDTRKTLVLSAPGGNPAFATFRKCIDGIKAGPLHAETREQVLHLLSAAAVHIGDGPLFIDVPDHAAQLLSLLESNGFVAGFETARMYSGTPPPAYPPRFYSIATMELG